jgi:hypothetical protein
MRYQPFPDVKHRDYPDSEDAFADFQKTAKKVTPKQFMALFDLVPLPGEVENSHKYIIYNNDEYFIEEYAQGHYKLTLGYSTYESCSVVLLTDLEYLLFCYTQGR